MLKVCKQLNTVGATIGLLVSNILESSFCKSSECSALGGQRGERKIPSDGKSCQRLTIAKRQTKQLHESTQIKSEKRMAFCRRPMVKHISPSSSLF